jgi:hypothetical protein
VTDVLDDAIRSFLIELLDATPLPPEFDEIEANSELRFHDRPSRRGPSSTRRSGLVAAAVACAVALAIAVVVLLIGAGGTQSDLPATNSTRHQSPGYYEATTTLVVDLSRRADQPAADFTNLAQIALFVTKGDVPDAVAAKLGGGESGARLARSITTKTDRRTSTVAITAVARNARDAKRLADSFASGLVQELDQKSLAKYTAAVGQLQTHLDDISSETNGLIAQVASNPPNVEQLRAQLLALQNQYSITYDSYSHLTTQGPSTSKFTVLERAHAHRISKTDYDTRPHAGT